jgi:two-component system, sensor histidine kinase
MSGFVNFSMENLERVFPFYFELDKRLRIQSSGPSLKKVIGDIDGAHFSDVFTFVRPRISIQDEFDSLLAHQNVVIILQSKNAPLVLKFRGQFLFLENSDSIFYFGSPWVTDVEELGLIGLSIPDFAIHDTITDNLQLLKSKEIVNDDMKRIADELIEQRNELIAKNREVVEIAKFPNQNPLPILRISFDGQLLYANQIAKEKFEINEFLEFLRDSNFYFDHVAGNVKPSEYQIKLNDRLYQVSIVPFQNSFYYNLYFNDVTEQEMYQKELLRTNSRLETLISSMQSALVAEDSERKIILVNQKFCDLFEIPVQPNLLKGLDCTDAAESAKHLFANEEGFVSGIERILAERNPVYGDQLVLKTGRVLERDYIPIYEGGSYQGHIWKYQDITELLGNKESLKRVEDKYRKIIEDLEFGLIEVDLDQRITKVYPAFCELTGYTESELLGMYAPQLLAFPDDLELINQQNSNRTAGESGVYETRLSTKEGGVKWVIISGAPIYDWKNEVIGSIGIHLDITERKKLEQDLRHATLEAKASVKAKEMFLANMSHEIRTPLNVIIGMSDILDTSHLDAEQSAHVRAILFSAQNLLSIVNDILDFSKIDSGYFELDNYSVSIENLVDELKSVFQSLAEKKGLKLGFMLDENVFENLRTDGKKLKQVVMNVLNNAIKFTEAGEVNVCIELIRDEPLKQRIRFSVIDTGVGIPNDQKENIFHSFIQADPSVSRKFGGTGLGLSISQKIIESMGSKIELKDNPVHVGSIFSFELDLEKSLGDSGKVNNRQVFPVFDEDVLILVAEDNPMNQLLVQTILKKEGLPFDMVTNGLEVLTQVSKRKYSVILMDIQMPEMDGLSALTALRSSGLDIPVIALTANAVKEEMEKYLRCGFNAVLTKPFKREELIRLIQELLLEESLKTLEIRPKINYTLDGLLEISAGDVSFVDQLVETLIENLPVYADKLQEALATEDIETIRYVCHQLKPSLDLLKVAEAAEIVREIEVELKDKNELINLRRNVQDLLHILNALVEELKRN